MTGTCPANTFYIPLGGFDNRSGPIPGKHWRHSRLAVNPEHVFRPRRYAATRCEHTASALGTKRSDFSILVDSLFINPNAYPGAPGIHNPRVTLNQTGTKYRGGGDYFFYNFAAVTPALAPADRQAFYGSFTRDVCDKYLTLFADFKYVRSFFDASLSAVPFMPDPFKLPGTNIGFSPMHQRANPESV